MKLLKLIDLANGNAARSAGIAIGVAGALCLSLAGTAQAADTWSTAIARTPTPHAGCFHATYPSTTWKEVACQTGPAVPFIPATGGGAQTVGNGHDYAAVVSGTVISSAVGTFPKTKGLKTETDGGTPNSYSLQLNSNFMSGSPACSGASNPSNCLAWLQYVYSAAPYNEAFMQYWLINYDTTCPAGWNSDGGDCYKNSAAVHVPLQ